MTMVVSGSAETLDAHIAFHLNAGVDFVLVTARGPQDETDSILEPYVREGYLRSVPARGGVENPLMDLARVAAAEHAAGWVIPSSPRQFWWPRGESLKDVLAVIPPRYDVVQAAPATFAGPGDG